MPTFTQRQPQSIATAFASFLNNGSPNISLKDLMAVDAAAANANYRDTMTENVRQQMNIERAREEFRNNPANVQEAARVNAGFDPSIGEAVRQHVMPRPGEMQSFPLQGPTPQGPALEGTHQQAPALPPGVTPAQLAAYRNTIGANFATRLGTGNTNAAQFTQAQENLQQQDIRTRIQDTSNPIARAVLHEALPGQDYHTNAQGVTTGPTGNTEVTRPELYNEYVRQHKTAADANAALAQRRGIPPAGPAARPPAPPRQQTPEQTAKTKEETEQLRLKNEAEKRKQLAQSQSQARSNFMREPAEIRKKYKGLGSRWIEGKGYEVIGLDGKPVPGLYYNEKGSGGS